MNILVHVSLCASVNLLVLTSSIIIGPCTPSDFQGIAKLLFKWLNEVIFLLAIVLLLFYSNSFLLFFFSLIMYILPVFLLSNLFFLEFSLFTNLYQKITCFMPVFSFCTVFLNKFSLKKKVVYPWLQTTCQGWGRYKNQHSSGWQTWTWVWVRMTLRSSQSGCLRNWLKCWNWNWNT